MSFGFGASGGGASNSPFGQSASAFGASSSGLFGQPTQQQSPFGGGGFGQSASTPFGGGGGGGSGFGQSAATPFGGGGSGFGQQSSSAFGAGFGQPSSTPFGGGGGGFGQSAPAPFGGGGFGQQSGTPLGGGSGFGQQTSSPFGGGGAAGGAGGFGGTTAPIGGGGFMQQAATGSGSRAFSYQPTPQPDTSDKYASITAMPQYASRCIEELRVEDYSRNDFGGTQQTQSGMFGATAAPQSGGSLFGQQSGNTMLGQPQNLPPTQGAFGQSTSSFGAFASGNSLFGQSSAQGGGGLFGAQQSGAAMFGAPSTPAFGAASQSGFGASSQSAFGQGSLFGHSASGFGTKPAAFGFGAASTPAQSSSLFGAPQSGGLFATPASSGGGLWGGSGAFGAKPNTASPFGSNPASSGFSLAASSTGGLFGASSAPGFGSTAFGAPTGGSLFGGGGFGAASSASFAPTSTFGSFGVTPTPQQQYQQPTVSSDPFGDGRLFEHVSEELKKERAQNNAPQDPNAPRKIVVGPLMRTLPYTSRPPGAHVAARRALGADLFHVPNSDGSFHMGSAPQPRFAESGRRARASTLIPWRTPAQAERMRNIKRLVIEPVNDAEKPANELQHQNRGMTLQRGRLLLPPPQPAPSPREPIAGETEPHPDSPRDRADPSSSPEHDSPTGHRRRRAEERRSRREKELLAATAEPPFTRRTDITTRPSLARLSRMNALELTRVTDFAIVRQGIGEVEWEGETDVTGLDIDRYVQLRYREIRVYPNEEELPPVGSALNKPAVIKLHGIWKMNKRTQEPFKDEKAAKAMRIKLASHCEKEGIRFIDYIADTGTWTFSASRF